MSLERLDKLSIWTILDYLPLQNLMIALLLNKEWNDCVKTSPRFNHYKKIIPKLLQSFENVGVLKTSKVWKITQFIECAKKNIKYLVGDYGVISILLDHYKFYNYILFKNFPQLFTTNNNTAVKTALKGFDCRVFNLLLNEEQQKNIEFVKMAYQYNENEEFITEKVNDKYFNEFDFCVHILKYVREPITIRKVKNRDAVLCFLQNYNKEDDASLKRLIYYLDFNFVCNYEIFTLLIKHKVSFQKLYCLFERKKYLLKSVPKEIMKLCILQKAAFIKLFYKFFTKEEILDFCCEKIFIFKSLESVDKQLCDSIATQFIDRNYTGFKAMDKHYRSIKENHLFVKHVLNIDSSLILYVCDLDITLFNVLAIKNPKLLNYKSKLRL
ncbi:hypothetical protein ABK040_009370 [Willaertia magna]